MTLFRKRPDISQSQRPTLPVSELRVGLYVHLDMGWMDHPFAMGSFKITSEHQIAIIRGLGVQEVKYSPELSDPPSRPCRHRGPRGRDGHGGHAACTGAG